MTTLPEGRDHTPPFVSQARHRSVRWLGWSLILAGVLLLVIWGTVTGVQLAGHARSLRGHLQALEQAAQGVSSRQAPEVLRRVGQDLAGTREDVEAIQALIGPLLPAGRLLRWVPVHGGDIAAAPELLRVAVGVSHAGEEAVRALLPALDAVGNAKGGTGAARSPLEGLLPVLVAARPQLYVADIDLARAEVAREKIDAEALSSQVRGLLARLDSAMPWLETGLDGAVLLPGLLGAGGPRTYLVLVQNNQELRATGGFISGVGELTFEDGRLASPSFLDSYAVDNFSVPHDLAPSDLAQVLGGVLWFFRDTNWDVDFPTSARRALDVYARDRGKMACGIIALDLVGLQSLIDAVGPLQVEGFAEPVSGQNLLEAIQAAWGDSSGGGADLAWWQHRKDFMGPMASAALARLLGGQPIDLLGLAQTIRQALDEKHLLVYFEDAQAEELIHARNWDGALPPSAPGQDLLAVVDSNVGFNKVDASIERSIDYQVDLAHPEQPLAHVTLTYRNLSPKTGGPCIREPHYGSAYADLMQGCYWDYVRIYVPAGSRLLQGPSSKVTPSAEPSPAISPTLDLGDWEVWAAFLEVAPGTTQTVAFDYVLPAGVVQHAADGQARYSLRVQKQPGTVAVPFHLSMSLPPGADQATGWPGDLASLQEAASDLRLDREFELSFRERGAP